MIRTFTSDLRRNITKILCLTIGMSVSMVLVAKIYYEKTYDLFFKDSERIYLVYEQFDSPDGTYDFDQTSGAYPPAMKRYLPQVEEATRFTWLTEGSIILEDGQTLESGGIKVADSCLFDVFRVDILAGDPHEALSVANHCMIPVSLAERIGGDPVGKVFSVPNISEDYRAVISGVYEDFPENSSLPNSIFMSLSTLKALGWDGSDNWIGNDAYKSFVKLKKGVSPDELDAGIRRMLTDNLPKEYLQERNFNIGVKPLVGYHSSGKDTGMVILMLTILAILMMLSSTMDYLMIVAGQVRSRSKEMAIRKCFGTGHAKIFRMIIGESALYVAISALLSVLLIFSLKGLCEYMVGVTPEVMFATPYMWLVQLLVIVLLLLLTGVVPAVVYTRTGIVAGLKMKASHNRIWKLALLGIQFCLSGGLICMLVLIGLQYRTVSNYDMGYDYSDIGMVKIENKWKDGAAKVMEELRKLSCVEVVGSGSQNFVTMASGGEIWEDERPDVVLPIADMMNVNREIFDVLGLKFIQGGTFPENPSEDMNAVVVDERMIKGMRDVFGIEDDNLIGRRFKSSSHGEDKEYTICGVVSNIHRGGFGLEIDTRPAVFFPSDKPEWVIYVRFDDMTGDNLKYAQSTLDSVVKDNESYIVPYGLQFDRFTYEIRKFAAMVLIVGIAVLLIALSGLSGYVADEVENRSKEIAIRKVSGTPEWKIVRLFCIDVLKISLPSLLIGALVAMWAGSEWLTNFSIKAEVSPVIFLLAIACLQLLILAMVVIGSIRVARKNPIEYLRNE